MKHEELRKIIREEIEKIGQVYGRDLLNMAGVYNTVTYIKFASNDIGDAIKQYQEDKLNYKLNRVNQLESVKRIHDAYIQLQYDLGLSEPKLREVIAHLEKDIEQLSQK